MEAAGSSKMTILEDVSGFEDRKNSILYCQPTGIGNNIQNKHESNNNVIFFPGDVQDFVENMKEHHNSKEWVEFSYEKTVELFSQKFSGSHIWLISPSKKIYKTFSIYKNFVKSEGLFGIPEYTGDYNGLLHLQKLFTNAHGLVFKDKNASKSLNNDYTITLSAFSKGCIVLNQFLYEVAEFSRTDNHVEHNQNSGNVLPFISRIKNLYWLDGGHSGEKDIWVKDKDVLKSLKTGKWCENIKIFIHLTPYQVKDKIHPWKGEEEAEFVSGLTELGVNFVEKLHFDTGDDDDEIIDKEASLRKHFEVMNVFVGE
uniref:UPF0565 protein C2orf69 homolog n=1 Tax=Styela clava TaxID=7725 RepID=UPI001939CB84|nr:UPF0565 protein C2orf69 homolog [Styela clava]